MRLRFLNSGNCALLGHYAVGIGNFLPTFRDNLSGPSSTVKNPNIRILDHCRWDRDSWPLKFDPIGFPDTSVRNYHYSLHNNPQKSAGFSFCKLFPTLCAVWCDRCNNVWWSTDYKTLFMRLSAPYFTSFVSVPYKTCPLWSEMCGWFSDLSCFYYVV
jgi:hypothetical protein